MVTFRNAQTPRQPESCYETAEFKVFKDPRISANKLGEFLVVDESRKRTILKNSKKQSKAVTLHYNKAKQAFIKAFRPEGFDALALQRSAARLRSIAIAPSWEAEENRMSADVLEKLAEIIDQITIKNATQIARPQKGWGGLIIADVNVSVNLDCVFTITHRGVKRLGAVILYTTKDKSKSLSRSLGDNSAGDYVATILQRHLQENFSSEGKAHQSICFVVDVHRRKIYQPTTRERTLFNHIEAACEGIASRWDDIIT